MDHDSPSGERRAGWAHLALAVLYAAAFVWHLKAVREHWGRLRGSDDVHYVDGS